MTHRTPQAIIDALLARFAQATDVAPTHDVDLVIADHAVRLRFAGPALADPLMPAMAHLVTRASTAAELTIHLWDSRSSGVDIIAAPWDMSQLAIGGTIPEAIAQGLYATYDMERERLVVLDPTRGLGVVWVRDPERLPRHELAAPLRSLFAAWFGARGLVITHAGAVARGGRGVLLGGRGGSGKSSTALACLAAGFDYAGDDYVLTEPEAVAAPRVHSLYATGKVFPRDAPRLARLHPGLVSAFADRDDSELAPDDKAIAYLARGASDRLSRGFPLVALLLPNVTGAPQTQLVPMPRVHALRALAPSTIVQHDGPPGPLLAALSRLVTRLPCYRLELGTQRDEIPDVIAQLIESQA